MSNIKEIIRQLAASGQPSACLVCTVDSVDKAARTVDCSPLDEGAPLLGVNLQANQKNNCGIVAFPKVGSFVVVGFVADGAAGVVLLTDEIDSAEVVVGNHSAQISADGIVFNGGNLKGLVNIDQLTGRLNAIEKDINNLKTVFSGWTPVAQDGGNTLKGAATSWAAQPLQETQNSHYEDTHVKH